MEVVEAHGIGLEAVMDAIDMKTFGLMAAIGKIELDNFRERASMGKRGTAKQGRIPVSNVPDGYRIGEGRTPEIDEERAEVIRRIFRHYVEDGMGALARDAGQPHPPQRGLPGHLVVRQGAPHRHRRRHAPARSAPRRLDRRALPGWQYRLRKYSLSPGGWGDWTDFLDSSGTSRRGRVSGLRPDTLYQFEVRAVAGALAGEASARARGLTQPASGLRLIQQGSAVVGDGRTEWRLPGGLIVVTIPAGMLVKDDGHARGGLIDLDSDSWLLLNLATGAEIRREIRNTAEGGRDVDALFDQIVASARVAGY